VAAWIFGIIDRLGAPGVGLLILLENLIPPIPSEVVLPLAGFRSSTGDLDVLAVWFAATLGAVVGALVVAWLGRFRHMGLTLLLVQVVFGLLIVAFSFSRVFWLSNVLLFGTGACLICVFSMTASLVQLLVPDHLRGRVMSIYMVAFRGGMPLGSLASGWAASLTSVPYVLAINGGLVSLLAVYFLLRSPGVRKL